MLHRVTMRLPKLINGDKLSKGGLFIEGLGEIPLDQAFALSDAIKKAAEKVVEVHDKMVEILGVKPWQYQQ